MNDSSRVRLAAGALLIALLLTACGSSSTASLHSKASDISEATAPEVYEQISTLIRDGGTPSVDALPGGGGVVWGVFQTTGGEARIDKRGVVLDTRGRAVRSFELPSPILQMGEVIIGADLFVLGFPCDGVIHETEATGWDCPATILTGYHVDLDTGAADSFKLPAEAEVDEVDQALPIGLLRVDNRLLIVMGTDSGTGWQAWLGTGADTWRPVDAPGWMPCQVGDFVVESALRPLDTAPAGAHPTATNIQDQATFTPKVRVFDGATGNWKPGPSGPKLSSASIAAPPTSCSASRLSIFTLGSGPLVVASFDPINSVWSESPLSRDFGPAAMSFKGVSEMLLFRFRSTADSYDAIFDPVSGTVSPLTVRLSEVSAMIPTDRDHILMIGNTTGSDVLVDTRK